MASLQDQVNCRRSTRGKKPVSSPGANNMRLTSNEGLKEASQDQSRADSRPNGETTYERNTVASQAVFRFLELPSELRNLIYDCLISDLVAHSQPPAMYIRFKRSEAPAVAYQGLGLLRTNRQIHSELGAKIYSQTFSVVDGEALYRFLGQIGAQNRSRIRKLRIERYTFVYDFNSAVQAAFVLLADAAPSFEELELCYDCIPMITEGLLAAPGKIAMHFQLVAVPFLSALIAHRGIDDAMACIRLSAVLSSHSRVGGSDLSGGLLFDLLMQLNAKLSTGTRS